MIASKLRTLKRVSFRLLVQVLCLHLRLVRVVVESQKYCQVMKAVMMNKLVAALNFDPVNLVQYIRINLLPK